MNLLNCSDVTIFSIVVILFVSNIPSFRVGILERIIDMVELTQSR